MATDYVTTPITKKGQLVYGCCLGVLTAVFRLFGGAAEGVSYAIIFCNILVPRIGAIHTSEGVWERGQKIMKSYYIVKDQAPLLLLPLCP